MSTPLVTIVIPVYNGSDYLREAIDSALGQTYPNIEVIIVNDGSNDGGKTREIATSYGDRITYIEKENGGVATALNTGIQKAQGKYVSWLSHDDAYDPWKIELQIPIMERYEAEGRKVIVYSSFLWMDERSVVYGRSDLPDVPSADFYQALLFNMVFNSALKHRSFSVHGCTMLFPKKVFDEVGFFDERLRTTQDFDLWFKMLGTYDFVWMDGYLVRSRVHKGQGTYKLRKERVEEVEDLYLNAFRLYRPGSERFDLDLPRAILAFKLMTRFKAYKAAREELKNQGFSLRSWSYVMRAIMSPRVVIRARVAAKYGWICIKKKFRKDRSPVPGQKDDSSRF